jgi:hypothetical protein
VLIQVVELAREYWLSRVTEAEERERAEAEAEKSQRREREEMFLVDPRSAPQLRDETRYGTVCRDDESVLWAEARLRQLGFLERRIGRVRQFTKEYGAVVVFADPRELGRVKFVVLRREQVDKPKSRRRWMPDHESFYLLDSWRNDLSKKLETRVGKAAGGTLPLLSRAPKMACRGRTRTHDSESSSGLWSLRVRLLSWVVRPPSRYLPLALVVLTV